jgi:hypothetical protein
MDTKSYISAKEGKGGCLRATKNNITKYNITHHVDKFSIK